MVFALEITSVIFKQVLHAKLQVQMMYKFFIWYQAAWEDDIYAYLHHYCNLFLWNPTVYQRLFGIRKTHCSIE